MKLNEIISLIFIEKSKSVDKDAFSKLTFNRYLNRIVNNRAENSFLLLQVMW